jgi:hypothetical protein
MKPISGLERPWIQWLFVFLGFVLVGVVAWQVVSLRRQRETVERLRAENMNARLERQQLESRVAREQSTREALALELARRRATGEETPREIPTLTLAPLVSRGSKPPIATVPAQSGLQIVELRLVLPKGRGGHTRYEAVLRDWSGGDVVWSRGGLVATTIDGQRLVAAHVTGDVLSSGTYEILLWGITMDGQKEEVAAYEVGVQ